MAVLRHSGFGTCVRPASHCLVGRAPSCHWVLDDPDVSREHAVVWFDGSGWLVRDLASRNGTRVGGELVKDAVSLGPGAILRFGSERNDWTLEEVDPPGARAVSRDGRVAVAE